ncbi:MAG TPA: hypothetical protein DER23_05265 [Clostridiales bacterium]|nr:hypothetical protein [Clostridiales bacterium]HCG35738.1 hypothetical protein [Clostridiales bacterium]
MQQPLFMPKFNSTARLHRRAFVIQKSTPTVSAFNCIDVLARSDRAIINKIEGGKGITWFF